MKTGWSRGLYWRVAFGFVALVTLVLLAQAVTFFWVFRTVNRVNADDLHEQAVTWTRAISSDLGPALEASPETDVAQRLAQIDVTRRVFVIFRDGRVIGSPPAPALDTVNTDFGLVPEAGPIPGAWERSVFAAAPLQVGGRVVGVIGITPRSTFERFGPLFVAGGMLVLVAAILLYSLKVVRPVRASLLQLETAAKRIGSGELTTRVEVDGTDEVAEVARAFNSMADDLERHTTALETSDRLRRQLVADVSHELMTPLTAVLGHLETLGMKDVRLDDRERDRQVVVATREARRLKRVIGDLLDAARYEAGGVELNQEEIETRELFDQVVARHAHECKMRRIAVDTQVGAGAELLEVDPFRMEQAIENVMGNALRHTPIGGRISLRASRNGDRVVIEVSDSGEGISSEHLPHIFDRFYKASSTNGLASPGSGLGLSIVKAIVIRHGGHISASSEPGMGTTILMEVPSPALVDDVDALALR